MNKSKTFLLTIALIILGATGAGAAWQLAKPDSTVKQSEIVSKQNKIVSLATTDAMKKEEAKYRTYVGDDYDRYYMANMIGHHQSAVDMAKLALTNAKHPELKTLANNIIAAQNKEITTMIDWQREWGYPPSTGENMADHSAMNMLEGMAVMTDGLKNLTGDEFDKAFLQMMIEHHESAVAMSRPANDNANHVEIKTLAAAVIADQTKEVLQMREWHEAWNYGKVPVRSADSVSTGQSST